MLGRVAPRMEYFSRSRNPFWSFIHSYRFTICTYLHIAYETNKVERHSLGYSQNPLNIPHKGYRMVFASICEHASSVFIFASTSSWQIFLASSEHFTKLQMASSEHFRKIQMASSEHFKYFELLRKFSASRNLSFILIGNVVLQQVIVNNRAATSKSEQ